MPPGEPVASAFPWTDLKSLLTSSVGNVILTAPWKPPSPGVKTHRNWIPCPFTLRRALREGHVPPLYSLRGQGLQKLVRVHECVHDADWTPILLLLTGCEVTSAHWKVSQLFLVSRQARWICHQRQRLYMNRAHPPRPRVSGRVTQTRRLQLWPLQDFSLCKSSL